MYCLPSFLHRNILQETKQEKHKKSRGWCDLKVLPLIGLNTSPEDSTMAQTMEY